MSVLSVRELSVTAGSVPLVSDVSLELAAGERLGIIGESGSGKTLTALAMMALLPDSLRAAGQVLLGGQDLYALSERARSSLRGNSVAMVFQEPMTALNPTMRVGRQIAEAVRIHRGGSWRSAHQRALDLLTRVEFTSPAEQARAYPHQLSGGQRQRVVLAMAIACDPDIILADEPTTALDVTVQAQMLDLMSRLVDAERSSLVLISHDLAVVSNLCDRILVMYGGRIVETGPTSALLRGPRHPYTAGLIATSAAISLTEHARPPAEGGRPAAPAVAAPAVAAFTATTAPAVAAPASRRADLPSIPGYVPAAGAFPAGCPFRTRCDRATEACTRVPPLSEGEHRVACFHPVQEVAAR